MPVNKRWVLSWKEGVGRRAEGPTIFENQPVQVMPVSEHEAIMGTLPVEVIGALTLGVGASYKGEPLDPRYLKLFYPRGQVPLGIVARLMEIRARISLINTDVDKPSAMKDGPDLFWACNELKAIAEELDAQANEEASPTSHTPGP